MRSIPRFHAGAFAAILCLIWGIVSCSAPAPIGFVGTMSGSATELGAAGRDGTQLALEGADVPLVVCNDHGVPDSGVKCIERFDSLGVKVVVGPMTSAVAKEIAREASKRGMFVVSPTVSISELSGIDDRFVKLMPENVSQAEILVRHCRGTGVRRVAVLFETRNRAYSEPLARRFERRMRESGAEIVFFEGYEGGASLDFKPWLKRIPDSCAVLVVGSSMDLGVFQQDRGRSGKSLPLVMGVQWSMGVDLLRVGVEHAEGMILVGMPEQIGDSPQLAELRERYRLRFGRVPNFGTVFAWEAAQVALRIASATSLEHGYATVLHDSAYAPLGWALAIDSLGDAHRLPLLCTVREGRFEVLE